MAEPLIIKALLAWSALAVALAWLAPARTQPWLVALCGAGLLLMTSPPSFLILAGMALLTFVIHARGQGNKVLAATGIVLVATVFLGFMVVSKPSSDGIETRIVLPLGLAFYSLRLIHYLFESYKGALRPHGLGEYLGYLFMPNTLPIGPIHRFDEFLRDLRRRRWDPVEFSGGMERILYGMAKLVIVGNFLIGDMLNGWIGPVTAESGALTVYLAALAFWIKLYVVFGGYSDIAIGFAAMMGFRIRENFNWPMLARNISDFWQRWHMSLSAWCRDYVFTPVLSATRAPAIAVLSSMVVLGIWHELSLRYVLWGAYHGAGIAVFRWFDAHCGAAIDHLPRWAAGPWRLVATALTLHFVIFSFHVTHALEQWLRGG